MRKDWNKSFNRDYSLRPYWYSLTYYIPKRTLIILLATLFIIAAAVLLTNYHATRYQILGSVESPSSLSGARQVMRAVLEENIIKRDGLMQGEKLSEQTLGYAARPLNLPLLSSFSRAIGYVFPAYDKAVASTVQSEYSFGYDRLVLDSLSVKHHFNIKDIKFQAINAQHYRVDLKQDDRWHSFSSSVGKMISIPNNKHPIIRLNVLAIHSRPGVVFYLQHSNNSISDSQRLSQLNVKTFNKRRYISIDSSHPDRDRLWMRDYLKTVIQYRTASLQDQIMQSLHHLYQQYVSANLLKESSSAVDIMKTPYSVSRGLYGLGDQHFKKNLVNSLRQIRVNNTMHVTVRIEPRYDRHTLFASLLFLTLSIFLLAAIIIILLE